jgi:hypothetical protein
MPDGLDYLDPRQIKKEIKFYIQDSWLESPLRTRAIEEMDRWRTENLPHHVDPDWSQTKPGRGKDEVRRWLNKNCKERWAYTTNGVSFESDRDSSLFRLWYG